MATIQQVQQVKTHQERLYRHPWSDIDDHNCEFCGNRPATYHSQKVDGYKALGRPIYHCQKHRNEGRQVAEVIGQYDALVPDVKFPTWLVDVR